MEIEKLTQRLVDFIPANLRLDIFASLLEEYKNKENLAKDIGCGLSTLEKWIKDGKSPNGKYMSKVVSLAIDRSSMVRELLRKEVFEEIECLSNELGILKESKTKGDINKLLEFLDEKSRQILMFLWWNRHAEIGELVELVGVSTDMEVLSKLKEVINPIAEKVFGREIVEFAESKIDQVTGEKILFSWWLKEKNGEIQFEKIRGPMVDVFDEKDGVTIIAQLPAPVITDHPEIEYKNNILRLRLKKGEFTSLPTGKK